MIWVLGLFLFHSFFTVKFEFIVLSLLYLGQVRVKPWKFASFCQALPLHAHSSLKWKSFLTNVMLHKGVYSLHTYNYSTWCRTPTKKTRSPPHWGLLDMNICHLNKCHQVHQFEDFTWPRRIGEKKKKVIFSSWWDDICLNDRCLGHKSAEHSVSVRRWSPPKDFTQYNKWSILSLMKSSFHIF